MSSSKLKEIVKPTQVYEYGPGYRFSQTETLAAESDTIITLKDYKWKLSYIVSEDDGAEEVQVFVDFESRYSFSDKVKLEVSIEENINKVIKTFDVENEKNQTFSVDLEKTGISAIGNIKVTCTVDLSDIQYCGEYIGTITVLTSSTRPHDVVLVVGDKKYYVHKMYLATWSKFFDNLFFGDSAELHKKEVKLEDVDADEFRTLMGIIHPDMHYRIYDSNVLYLLKLADRFKMPSVTAMCGNHLKDFGNCPNLSLIDRLELSDKFSLTQLQVACLGKCHQMNATNFKTFLDDNREKIKKFGQNTLKNLL